ncbi:MAG TPA: hypothetical protein VGI75_04855 [Pirellulales bacterium]|jgi:hypothetical protein
MEGTFLRRDRKKPRAAMENREAFALHMTEKMQGLHGFIDAAGAQRLTILPDLRRRN